MQHLPDRFQNVLGGVDKRQAVREGFALGPRGTLEKHLRRGEVDDARREKTLLQDPAALVQEAVRRLRILVVRVHDIDHVVSSTPPWRLRRSRPETRRKAPGPEETAAGAVGGRGRNVAGRVAVDVRSIQAKPIVCKHTIQESKVNEEAGGGKEGYELTSFNFRPDFYYFFMLDVIKRSETINRLYNNFFK